jgi:hypothetical protein
MIRHLHSITLRHWDTNLRVLGASALESLLSLGDRGRLEDSLQKELGQLSAVESGSVHGALVALAHITSILSEDDNQRCTIFSLLSVVRPVTLVSPQGADISQAICELMAICLTKEVLALPDTQGLLDRYIDISMKRREEPCHEAVAKMVKRLSELEQNVSIVKK